MFPEPCSFLHTEEALVRWFLVSICRSHRRALGTCVHSLMVCASSPHRKQYCGVGGFGVTFGACGGRVAPLVAAAATQSAGVSLPFFFFLFFLFLGWLGSGTVVIFVPPPLPGPIVNIVSLTLTQWDLAMSTQFMILNGL